MEKKEKEEKVIIKEKYRGHHMGGGAYGLGFIGVLIYYLQSATTFQEGVIGFLKALLWPAFLVHKIYTILGM